ncbi:MAG: thiamine biosynthesis protein ThiJ [Bdellovibrionales bacterium RIFOXYB1_FULL_37_110]|nr:MAG: thiamine biosynthesis protein ThiJ [Bdellovibrionales bacterium RIFOXYC1_FULL_37_79]OFZ58105.1 MAG: thiamine biosynthesis protein ThiJ [Bdellovibrionales bacterium RIFOXYB1_FULL_37_110]OFZ61794.1 MAG: thiamine biosynthesis protein ThiJ [Bdellovibrionales bacterium RIFOXYD1_FULL_36_51]
MPTICIPLARGFEELEAITLIDILRRAKINVIIAGVNEEWIEGSHQIKIKTDTLIKNVTADQIDMILLPGGMQGTQGLCQNQYVQGLIKELNQQTKTIGAICAAPLALDTAQVLKGRFTCYPGLQDQIKSPHYEESPNVIIDKNIMTSKGPATAMEFALEIVKFFMGKNICNNLKKDLLY